MRSSLKWIALAFAIWALPAQAQVASWPPPAGAIAFLGVYNAAPPTLATGNVGFVQVDSLGRLLVNVAAGGGGGPVTIANGADVALGSTTDAACGTSTGTCTLLALVKYLNSVGIPVTQASQYPTGATAITASATGTTGATTATLAGVSNKTTYICGYSIRANATAAATVTDTITGTITGTLSSVLWVAPLASGLGVDEQIFSPCIPASATNTGIAIVSGAPGTGGTVTSKGWGYQL